MPTRRYFGTDGIRGRVGEWPITAEFMLKLGRAAGAVFGAGSRRKPVFVIGKDTRVSGYMFESALEAGLVAAGAEVRLLGPMPTPGVAYLTHSLRADAGIVISASHNPYQDNGIKFFSESGEKLEDAVEAAIEAEIDAPFTTVDSASIGKVVRIEDAIARYTEFCKSTVPDLALRDFSIVLDCANGATYQIAPRVFRELGARLSAIGNQPDGLNINRECGSTHPDALAKAVVESGASLGIAFDGDGDRVQMIDGKGQLVDGDQLLYLLATDWQRGGRLRGPVVGTLMSNFGLEQAMGGLGVAFERANVGDRHVMKALKEKEGVLGGETSGHILCLDRASTGDGIVSALQVLDVLARRGCRLDEAVAGMRKIPQTTVNVRITGRGADAVTAPAVQRTLAEVRNELAGRGRVVLRPSGTEPVVRVTIEAADAAEVERLAARLATVVEAAVN
ncbi:MAG: phosphoglucosamine mutase [Lysobacterales bacterium]